MEQTNKILVRKKLLQKAFKHAQIGVWYWDIKNDEIIINEAWTNLIGYSAIELDPFTPDNWVKICHPNDQEFIIEKMNEIKSAKINKFSIRLRLQHKNGNWLWVQCNGEKLEVNQSGDSISMSGTLIDLSELYQSKDSLLYRYKIEKLVSEISTDFVGVATSNIDFIINKSLKEIGLFMNIDRCYIFQFRKNNSFIDNTHEWCADNVNSEIDNLQNLPSSTFPWWMKKMNKREHIYIKQVNDMPEEAAVEKEILESQQIISLLVVPIHFQNNLLGFIGFDSIKEQREWLDADIHLISTVAHTIANAFNSKKYQEVLIRAKKQAEESDKIKSAFLATINHELRTPLHHILGFSELLQKKTNSVEESAIYAKTIHKSGKKLLQIIEDILNLALADQEFVKLRKESFKGIDLFEQHKTLLNELLVSSNKNDNISIRCNSTSEFTNNHFIADINKINLVIANLFKNAIKFTSAGYIEYHVELVNNKISFQIKDSGIGIPKHKQKLIFDYFRQIDDFSTRTYGGIGAGLAISQRIAKILGAKITVKSTHKKGSLFVFEVPFE